MATALQFIYSANINKKLWDETVYRNNGMIYSTSLYLDTMTENWCGLVLDEYKAILPVPYKVKFGIKYCYAAPFIQQTGWIGNIDNLSTETWIKILLTQFRYGDIFFNHQNSFAASFRNIHQRTNFIIDLTNSYATVSKNYTSDLQRNLNRVAKLGLVIEETNDIELAVQFYQTQYSQRVKHISPAAYLSFKSLCIQLQQRNQCIVRLVKDAERELLSCAIFLLYNNRIYNIMNSTNEAGRKKESNVFLLDNVLKEFAGSNLLFDFEGSDIPGVKAFYEKFGAINQPYYHWHFNELPLAIKWLKK